MALNFPSNPTLNQEYTSGSKTWFWNGSAWQIKNISVAGISGYSGFSGYSGSGISGFSGRSGYSGSGISGFSGFSGISGYSGFSGISGFSGRSGYSGWSGISGYSGSGVSGYSGWSGLSGYSGAAGSSTSLNATDDAVTATLYPVMVGAVGSNQTVKATTTKLNFNASTGTLAATTFNSLSDATLKENVSQITDAVTTINKIDGVEFTWKDTGRKSYGVIAQEIEKILPDVVETNEHGIKTVNYDAMTAFFIQAIKELSAEVEQLKNK